MTKITLTGLQSSAYEHPFDRQALAALKKMPGVSPLLKKINEYGIDRLLRLQSLSSEIKITEKNFPKLYHALVEACEILDVKTLPDYYLFRGTGHIKTYVIGVEKPLLGINLDAMEWLNSHELVYILGYEIAKIKSQHIIYHQIANVMPNLKTLISNSTLGFGGLLAGGLELALYNWVMMAKLTSDRAGLLACQDIDIAITSLMKIAGLPEEYLTDNVIDDFITQSREFTANNLDNLDKLTKIFSYTEYNLSWSVMRAGELLKWVDSGEYESLLQNPNQPNLNQQPEIETNSDDKEEWRFLGSW